MSRTIADAFELLVQAEHLGPRLEAAATALGQLAGFDDEQAWLAAARARLGTIELDAKAHAHLLARALRLPELAAMKAERGKLLQIAVADEVERLEAAITLVSSGRSPLLDTLFLDLKLPVLRKCTRNELEKFCVELERRINSSYAKRLLATERYVSSVVPTVTALRTAIGTWASVFVEPPLEGGPAEAVREAVLTACHALELPLRQARLLAQAALLPTAELFDAAGLLTPLGKKRALSDSHPILDKDPPDPLLPTPDERAEITELHASA